MIAPLIDQSKLITIERHILDEQLTYPEATGALTSLLYDIALAGKVIASNTTRGGLVEVLGSTADTNVQGEQVMRLDRLADQTMYRLNYHTGRLAVMASEENEGILPIPEKYPTGKYVLLYDPLDGSSNIDYNMSIGTIFSVYRRKSESGPGTLEDCLQPGRDLVAAGYLLYSTSTMLIYTTGRGVHGFTLRALGAVGRRLQAGRDRGETSAPARVRRPRPVQVDQPPGSGSLPTHPAWRRRLRMSPSPVSGPAAPLPSVPLSPSQQRGTP